MSTEKKTNKPVVDTTTLLKTIVILVFVGLGVYLYINPPGAQEFTAMQAAGTDMSMVNPADPYGFRFGIGALGVLFALIIINHFMTSTGRAISKRRNGREQ